MKNVILRVGVIEVGDECHERAAFTFLWYRREK